MFGYRAIEMILTGYMKIAKEGKEARIPLLNDFLMASNYAGIAFGNAGCAAVHALSYPLGATFHVPHGEANYAMFTGVFIYTQSGFRTVLYKSCEYGLCLSIQSYLLTDAAGFR